MLLKLKEGIQADEKQALYDAIMSLQKIAAVESVTAGENFSSRSKGYDFGFQVVTSDLDAYLNDPFHVQVRDKSIVPLTQADGVLSCDYEWPRALAHSASGQPQSWDVKRSCPDLKFEGASVAPVREGHVWRMAVSSQPVRSTDYADFEIDLNPKPNARGIEIGLISRSSLEGATETGKNFLAVPAGVAWTCNGPIVTSLADLPEMDFKRHPWEHDHTVGVFVDREKGLLQFFFDRKKVGPAIHSRHLQGDEEWYFAMAIATDKVKINAHWSATCPKVFLG